MTMKGFFEELGLLKDDLPERYSEAQWLVAVSQDGNILQHVQDQTEEICLAAVKQDGHALRHVKKQTDKICLTAVEQNRYALQYVHHQTDEICLAALTEDWQALPYVRIRKKGIYVIARDCHRVYGELHRKNIKSK